MKRFIIAGLLAAVVLAPSSCWLYLQGVKDGVARYRHSRVFQQTLYSMYVFGYIDGKASCKEKK